MRFFDTDGSDVSELLMAGRQTALRQVVIERRLARILAFTRLTIDDVVNCRMAKRQVLGYFKLSRQIERRGEVLELERQWNPTGAG